MKMMTIVTLKGSVLDIFNPLAVRGLHPLCKLTHMFCGRITYCTVQPRVGFISDTVNITFVFDLFIG